MTTALAQLRNSGKVSDCPRSSTVEQRTFNPWVRRSTLRGGTTSSAIIDLPANMQSKVQLELCPRPDLPGFCWAWTGAIQSKGYGSVGYQGRRVSTHRLAYELLVGPIPGDLTIDHLCENKPCCNPAHLEPVTRLVNIQRAHHNRDRCPQGHPLAGPNLAIRIRRGGERRYCRTCQYDWQQQRYHRANPGRPRRSTAAKRQEILATAERALRLDRASA